MKMSLYLMLAVISISLLCGCNLQQQSETATPVATISYDFLPYITGSANLKNIKAACIDIAPWVANDTGMNISNSFDSTKNPTKVILTVSPTVDLGNGILVFLDKNHAVQIGKPLSDQQEAIAIADAIHLVDGITKLVVTYDLEMKKIGNTPDYSVSNLNCKIP